MSEGDRSPGPEAEGLSAVWPPMIAGPGVLADASRDWGRYIVVTTASPWGLAMRLVAPPTGVVVVESLEWAHLDGLVNGLSACDRIVGLGGGLALDGAKVVAARLGRPLVLAPTSASNNAAFTTTAGCLDGGRRKPLRGTPVPEAIVVDTLLVARAPARLNRAGVGDLLSSHTALWDWEAAHRAGRDVDWDVRLRDRIRLELARLARLAPLVGRDDPDAWLALLSMGERLAPEFLAYPRARFNAASEHLLAWCLEERTGRRLLHGEIVCLGVLLMSHLQGHAPEAAAAVVGAAGVPVQPEAIGTTWDEVEAAVLALPGYAREVVPWYTVVDELVVGEADAARLRERLVAARDFVETWGG